MNSKDFNEQNNNLINSNEMKNNDLLASNEFMFNFNKGKFLWKELMKINTKYIERSGEISLITPYVQNILYSRLTLDNIDMLSEEYIVQLVTLLQLTGQYLVYTQRMLEEENEQLKEQINYLKMNITDNDKYQRIIEDLNRQNQEKDFLIKTYQDMIQTRNGINEIDNKNLKSNKDDYNSNKNYYYCSICSGKKFKSKKYLDEHMERRHYNQYNMLRDSGDREERKVQDKDYKKDFEDKLNMMKNEIEAMIKQKEENNEFALLNKRLALLQNQILEQNYNNMINFKNNINYQRYPNYPPNSVKKEVKETSSTNTDYKKKYEELYKNYKDFAKRDEEKQKMLVDLQNLVKKLEIDKNNNKLNTNIEDINKKTNIEIERTRIKSNTNDRINININSNKYTDKDLNINNQMNKKEKDINYKQNNNINKGEDKKSENVNKGEEENKILNKNDKKIFVNNENITPTGLDTLKGNEINNNNPINNLEVNNTLLNTKTNNNINFNKILDSNIIDSNNPFISQNNIEDNEDKLKTDKKLFNQPPVNDISEINNNDKKDEAYVLTVSKFCKEFEKRNENYQGEEDYNKIKIPSKYNIDVEKKIDNRKEEIKEKLNNNSISSNNVKKLLKDNENRDSIYKKYYNKLNEVIHFKEILDSYNKYQQEKNKNQMIERPSGVSRPSIKNISGNNSGSKLAEGNYLLKTSTDDYKPPVNSVNPFSNRPSKISNGKLSDSVNEINK